MAASSGASLPGQKLRVLADTNILLDLVLAREPWASEAKALWDSRDQGRVLIQVAASVLTDIFYSCRKQVGSDRVRLAVEECLRRCILVPVDRTILEAALALPGSDFEDNVQIACAQAAQLDLIITRNVADFTHLTVPAMEPAGVVDRL
jgi:predicted nucleic acid-binding protein